MTLKLHIFETLILAVPSSVLIARENGCGDPPGWLKTLMVRSTNPAVSVVTYETGSYPTSNRASMC